ncbi:TM0106 family RecB-like putative nuclease [Gloeocapsa sp. PCC 73106]|uniref:TM0106 family RecB-like putative nuclease n=1 Tax=Gloeocapsa sp. PCC 73106 TaxID=102232 RepID=UPI0002ABD178|nr:TM0106 family RecB-like putative nuclease [Gloeocapsa sp. PCC 73106]ELR97050.1 RecB family nuclease, putative, TM0106 family [Gloeocapsa sp. PCC 73106]
MLTDQLLLDYKRCQRRAYLNIHGDWQLRDRSGDFRLKLRQESSRHVQAIIDQFYPNCVYLPELDLSTQGWQQQAQATQLLMQQGQECIYHGVLYRSDYRLPLVGVPHLLIKQPGTSCFGDWCYLPITIQLGRRPKPEYKLMAAFYAYLLQDVQKTLPPFAEIILRRQNIHRVDLKLWLHKLQQALAGLLGALASTEEPEVFISRQRCNLCQWYSHCYTLAKSHNHLSLVPGITPSRYQQLKAIGIDSLASLAEISSEKAILGIDKEVTSTLKQQALSILENRPLEKTSQTFVNKPLISANVEFYFDIEAEPERQLDYLLGVLLVDRQANTETFYPFLAEHPEQEGQVWRQFVDLVTLYPHSPIFHYSEYEIETIKRLAKLYQTPKEQRQSILSRLVDLHAYVLNSVIFPVESYSLKSLANWLGFYWRNPHGSGEQSVYWYDQWLTNHDRQSLQLILNYNEDDCRATRHLKDWLSTFSPQSIGDRF